MGVELDVAPRAVDLPDDLSTALAASPTASRAWANLSHSHQRRHVESVLSAKRPETRARRVAATVESLAGD